MRPVAILTLLLASCTPLPTPVEPDPGPADEVPDYDPAPDAAPVEGDPEDAACAKFEELGCQARDGRNLWEPTPGGVECPDVFRNASEGGVNLNAPCIAKITSCNQRSKCTDS